MMSKKILLCGHRSFAAKGLVAQLESSGHEVVCFSRGQTEINGQTITGPVAQVHVNPHLEQPFDTVINYILLGDQGKDENEVFLDSLVQLCESRGVQHLIHISSISVYKAEESLIHEGALMEPDPNRKGAYGSLKIIQDQFLQERVPASIKLSLVRPGFILGSGHSNPIAGTGFRTPWNRLLLLGNNQTHLPLISRDQVNRSLTKLVDRPPEEKHEVLVLTDSDSPTKQEYLDACCELLGCGTQTIALPKFVWLPAAAGASTLLHMAGKGDVKLFQRIQAVCQDKDFDSRKTEERLGESFRLNWKDALLETIEGQSKNFHVPVTPADKLLNVASQSVTFMGFGRIVHQKHLPSLEKLGFNGSISAYDVGPIRQPDNHSIKEVNADQIASSDLFVVATPGPVHHLALEQVREHQGDVLIEKPLCYNKEEFSDWKSLQSNGRKVYACHNYRFKKNVLAMQEHLRKYNPGRLISVNVDLQTPPVCEDGALWMRKERQARTLLMDYSLHYLDIACMYGQGDWTINSLHHDINTRGETANIRGDISAENYSVSFSLRQGFIPRKHQIIFNFQNYSLNLRFFPDVMVAHMANDYDWVHRMEARKLAQGIRSKVVDKVLGRDSDLSHPRVYQAALTKENAEQLRLDTLEPFYKLLFEVSDRVYGSAN